LATAAIDWARGDGADALTLWVADGNSRARELYERLDFRPTGVRQALPSNPAVGEDEFSLALGTPGRT
jgi:RimJ/RimL family protein N-acetyltransferase